MSQEDPFQVSNLEHTALQHEMSTPALAFSDSSTHRRCRFRSNIGEKFGDGRADSTIRCRLWSGRFGWADSVDAGDSTVSRSAKKLRESVCCSDNADSDPWRFAAVHGFRVEVKRLIRRLVAGIENCQPEACFVGFCPVDSVSLVGRNQQVVTRLQKFTRSVLKGDFCPSP